jgi:BolA protein
MKVQKSIEEKLLSGFKPTYLNVLNESHQHSVPPGSETHFRVELVTADFEHMNRVARSRKVYEVLATELREGVHALSLKLFSPAEWAAAGEQAGEASPACHGGSKG